MPKKKRRGRRHAIKVGRGKHLRRSPLFRKRSRAAKKGWVTRRANLEAQAENQAQAEFERGAREGRRFGRKQGAAVARKARTAEHRKRHRGGVESVAVAVFVRNPDEKARPFSEPINEFSPGVIPRTWRAHLKLTREGVTIFEEERFEFPAVEWYYTGAALMRFFQLWRDTVRAIHPELFEESPSIGLVSLALVA